MYDMLNSIVVLLQDASWAAWTLMWVIASIVAVVSNVTFMMFCSHVASSTKSSYYKHANLLVRTIVTLMHRSYVRKQLVGNKMYRLPSGKVVVACSVWHAQDIGIKLGLCSDRNTSRIVEI
jgi:hypothetical protein